MIPIAKPLMGEAEAAAASRAILSGWTTQGPEVAAFENEFASYVDAQHACAVSNCTTALHMALLVAGVKPGDEVITVSHSYIATANCIRYCNATPVFVDVDAQTYNMQTELIEAAISDKTRAILCVHQIGMPCDMPAIVEIGKRHSLPVIEDAACGIGAEIEYEGEWQKIGKPHGDVACFSFHPRKLISTGDGGMITTNNPEWHARFRALRQHAMSVPDTVRHGAKQVIFESYPEIGFNYRMTDIQAAVGREQIKRLPHIIQSRRNLADHYNTLLASVPGVLTPFEPEWARSNYQSYCVCLPDHCDQREVMQSMLDNDVSTRRGVMCIHREPAYAEYARQKSLQQSERVQDRCILLPLYTGMTADQQAIVVDALKVACGIEFSDNSEQVASHAGADSTVTASD